jgi:hypothetical protein
MANKDENPEDFLEIINAIIPSLNGHDSEHYGPKVMIKPRYLILLYVAGRIFKRIFGMQFDNNIYFSTRSLERIAKHSRFRLEGIKFERSRAMKDHYSNYVGDGMIIHIRKEVPTKNDPSKTILTDLIALTKKGEEYCKEMVMDLFATLPEHKRPTQKLTKNIVPSSNSYENFEKECQSYGLNWLRADYFEFHKSTETDFDNWKKGFPVDLPFIKAKREQVS